MLNLILCSLVAFFQVSGMPPVQQPTLSEGGLLDRMIERRFDRIEQSLESRLGGKMFDGLLERIEERAERRGETILEAIRGAKADRDTLFSGLRELRAEMASVEGKWRPIADFQDRIMSFIVRSMIWCSAITVGVVFMLIGLFKLIGLMWSSMFRSLKPILLAGLLFGSSSCYAQQWQSTCPSCPNYRDPVNYRPMQVVQNRVQQARPGVSSRKHWMYPGTIENHMRTGHGVPANGIPREQLLNMHDAIHENRGMSAAVQVRSYQAQAYQTVCPSCPNFVPPRSYMPITVR